MSTVPAVLVALDERLATLAFTESAVMSLSLELVSAHGRDPWCWNVRDGFVREARVSPTCHVRVDEHSLAALLDGRVGCRALLDDGRLVAGGLLSDWDAFLSRFESEERQRVIDHDRLMVQQRSSTRAKARMADIARRAMREIAPDEARTRRLDAMLGHWVDHRAASIEPQRVEVLSLPDLETQPWHDDHDTLQIDRYFDECFDDLRREAMQLVDGTLSVPLYGHSDPTREDPAFHTAPPGWRSWFLIDTYRAKDTTRFERFPATTRLLERLAPVCSVIHAAFLVLEPGVSIPVHVDGGSWAVSYQYGLIVPKDCSLTVAGETRAQAERRSLTFDDAYFHSTRNASERTRVVFSLVCASPRLTPVERACLGRIAGLVPRDTLIYLGEW